MPRANSGRLPNSSYFLESGDFFRINNVTVGYSLPSGVLNRLGVQSLRFYATVQNLATFTGYSGFTPELPGSNIIDQGLELNAYPSTRTWAFGVNLSF